MLLKVGLVMPLENKESPQMPKQFLREFEVAVSSECRIDEHYCRVFGLNGDAYKGLPRPSKWVGFAKNKPKTLFLISRLCKLAWVCGGGAIYYLLQMSSYYCRSLFVPYKACGSQVDAEYALGFSARGMDVIGDCSLGRNSRCRVLFPWVSEKIHLDVLWVKSNVKGATKSE